LCCWQERNALASSRVLEQLMSCKGVCIAVQLRWEREIGVSYLLVLVPFDMGDGGET
jgi:hypothetical protein